MDEIGAFGWDAAQVDAFLRTQFAARQQVYRTRYPIADSRIVLYQNTPAGRFLINRLESAISIIDIAVVPAYRRRGIASFLIAELKTEAADSDRSIELKVDRVNLKARRLYENMGFTVTTESDLLLAMEWNTNLPIKNRVQRVPTFFTTVARLSD